ncbi:MAG: cation-translocating P-type ATPase, partial [Planctomycetia bacterium]|nr:cation-translocating P-type ATPase [Planctomycetia bacterium]
MSEAGTTRTLRVQGMDCAGCALAVRGALEAVSGVRRAEVDFASGLAEVTGDAGAALLCAAVERAGYRAEAVESFEDPHALRAEVEARQAAALAGWRRRAIVGAAIWVPLESVHWWAQATHAHAPWVHGFMLAGSALSMLLVGGGFWRSAWSVLRRGRTNMDVLIALGATTAFAASLVTFVAQRRGALLDQPTWFSEAAALLAIISVGHWMEAAATRRAGEAVRELLELQPDRVERVLEGRADEAIETRGVRPGDRLRVRPGGRVPVDGVIERGEAELDESVVTGESLPVSRGPGARVAAGSLNLTGELVVCSEVDGRGTSLARVALQVQ